MTVDLDSLIKGTLNQKFYGVVLRDGEGVEADSFDSARYFKLSDDEGKAGGEYNYGRVLRVWVLELICST